MKHEYYQYNAEEILSKGPKFPLIIMKVMDRSFR